MKRARTWVAMALIFAAGVVVGGVGGLVLAHRKVRQVVEGGPPAVREVVVRGLTRRLKLTADQQVPVREAVTRAHGRMIALRRQHQPEAEQIVADAVAEIAPALTSEQSETLDAMYARLKSHWAGSSAGE